MITANDFYLDDLLEYMKHRYGVGFSKFYDNFLKLLMDDEVTEIDSNLPVKYKWMLKDTIKDLIEVHDIECILKFMYAASAPNNSVNRMLIEQVIGEKKVGNFYLRDIINDFNRTLNSDMISIFEMSDAEIDIDEFWKEHISEFYATIVSKVLLDFRTTYNQYGLNKSDCDDEFNDSVYQDNDLLCEYLYSLDPYDRFMMVRNFYRFRFFSDKPETELFLFEKGVLPIIDKLNWNNKNGGYDLQLIMLDIIDFYMSTFNTNIGPAESFDRHITDIDGTLNPVYVLESLNDSIQKTYQIKLNYLSNNQELNQHLYSLYDKLFYHFDRELLYSENGRELSYQLSCILIVLVRILVNNKQEDRALKVLLTVHNHLIKEIKISYFYLTTLSQFAMITQNIEVIRLVSGYFNELALQFTFHSALFKEYADRLTDWFYQFKEYMYQKYIVGNDTAVVDADKIISDEQYYVSLYNFIWNESFIPSFLERMNDPSYQRYNYQYRLEWQPYKLMKKLCEDIITPKEIESAVYGINLKYFDSGKHKSPVPQHLKDKGKVIQSIRKDLGEIKKDADIYEFQRVIQVVLSTRLMKQERNYLNEKIDIINKLKTSYDNDKDPCIEKINELISNITDTFKYTNNEQYVKAVEYIKNCEETFIDKYIHEKISLLSKLPDKERNEISDFLITSKMVYDYLNQKEFEKKVDFAAALIPMTKALELLLAFYIREKGEDPADSALAGLINQFLGVKGYNIKAVIYNKNSKKRVDDFAPRLAEIYDREHKNIVECNMFDIEHLMKFKDIGLDVTLYDDKNIKDVVLDKIECRFKKNNTSQQNAMLLGCALHYVRENYRNVVAHKDPIKKTTVEHCYNLMIQTKNLLWILLYIYKPKDKK